MPEIHFVWTYAPSQRFRSSVLRPAPARREQAVEDLVDARGVPDAVHVVTGLGVAQNTLLDVVVGHREGLVPRPVRRTKHLLPDAANQYKSGIARRKNNHRKENDSGMELHVALTWYEFAIIILVCNATILTARKRL